MNITEEEKFAISKLFSGANELDLAVISRLRESHVVERKHTGVGYFVTIKFPSPLPNDNGLLQRDWNFQHSLLKHGGAFMAFYSKPDIIELEAVAHDGNWPSRFNPEDFSDYD